MINRVRAAAIVVALVAVSAGGCRAESSPEASASEPSAGSAVVAPATGAEFVSLYGAVESLQRWSWVHLETSLKPADKAGGVPAGLWDAAVADGIRVTEANHPGCAAAALSREEGDRVEVKVTGCADTGSVVSAVGCVVLAPPTGTVRAVQEAAFTGGSPLRFVESPAQAAPGTWHVGAC